MKRIISLVLAIALLCSFVPVALAETATPVLAFELGAADPRTATAEDGTTISYYRVPVAVKNNSESDVLISTYECYLKFDAQSINVVDTKGIELEDGSYLEAVEKGENGTVSAWNKPSVGLLDNGNCVGAVLANDAGVRALKVKPDASVTLIYVNFVAAEDAEKGFKSIQFAKDVYRSDNTLAVNLVSYYDETTKTTTDYSESDGALDCSSETTVEVKTGTTPVLARVELVADDDNLEIPYGTEKEITLKAFSKKNTDVTSFVTFSIDGYTGDGLKIRDNQLTVSAENPANVGKYTVVATPDGTNCTLAEGASAPEATFTITSKKVTDPKVEITDFVKGKTYFDMHVNTTTPGLTVRCIAYEGEGIDQNNQLKGGDVFKADTTYTIVITLTANANYVIDTTQKLTYTINGGEEQEADIVDGPTYNGVPTYQAVVTATTADKDTPTIVMDDLTATYGDLLSTLTPTGTATYNNQTVQGTFAWSGYDAGTTVGDAGEQTFNVVFTPAQQEVYATVTGTVKVNVAKKQITFTKSDYEWKSINDDPYTLDDYKAMCFQYDKNEHGIEPTCTNNDISDLVEFEVSSNNKSTNVIAATVTAKVLLKDEYAKNYKFDTDNTNIQSATLKVLPIVVDGTGEYTHSVEVCYTTSSVDIPLSAFGLPENVLTDTNNKYWMRNKAVVVDEGNVLPFTPTAFDDTKLTLTLNLKSSLTKADANKTASVTLGLKVNNYETINPGVEEIAGGEDKLFILKLNVKIIEKEDAGLEVFGIPETMVYGDTVRAGSPDGYYHTVKKEGKNATFSAMISDIAVVAFDDDEGLAAKGVGTATITCTYESDTTFATKTFTINVTPKGLTANVSHDPITYGDAAPEDGYTVEFDGLVNGDNITDYTVGTEYTAGKPAGTYKITCALGDSIKNYTLEAKDVTGELVVKPKQLTAEDVTVTVLGETPVYDGSKKIPAVEVKYGETTLAAADYTVSYSNNVNAGVDTATVTVTSTDDSSYKFTATKNFTIAQAPISGAVIDDIADVTYDTKAHTPEVTVMFNGSPLTDADYTVSYSEDCINAGTVTVTVTGKGNFTGTASKTFTINKAGLTLNPCTISELCTETDLKTRTLPSDFFLAGETETGFSIALSVRNVLDIFAKEPEVVSGENKITYQLNGKVGEASYFVTVTPVSHNYNVGEYDLTISTHDRTDVSGSIEFKDGSAVYTGSGITYERATLNGNSFNMTYSYKPTSNGAKLDAKGLPLTVGTYTVTAAYSDANSYGTAQATFTITKATPTGTPGYTKLESSGKTLADAKLTVGTIRPAGTIAWDLPLTTVLEDGKAYAWTFTPNDTHNYTILTGTLIPYVDDGMDYIPGVIGGNTGSFNFHDVSRLDYFYDAVKWAAENGIASGTGRYTFSPNAVCTRAQTVTFLWRAAGSPLPRYRVCPFTDVQPNDYYYNAVLWAVEQGITTGLNATTFGPDVTVTRGQVATFLYRAASAAKPNTFNPFADVKTTAYNYDAILWAYDNRITTGTSDTTFSPDAYCTRAQIVTFLYRYYQGR